MNRLFILLNLLFNLAFGQDQKLMGRYISNDSYVVITDSSLEFKIANDGLITYSYGYCLYRIVGDTIYANTVTTPNGYNSYYIVTADLFSADKVSLTTYDKSEVLPFYNFVLVDNRNNEIIQGGIADKSGCATLDRLYTANSEDFSLKISSLGYDNIEIPLNEIIGKSISVYLQPYKVLENKAVEFKWVSDRNSVKLTGPFFRSAKKQKRRDKNNCLVNEGYGAATKEFIRQ